MDEKRTFAPLSLVVILLFSFVPLVLLDTLWGLTGVSTLMLYGVELVAMLALWGVLQQIAKRSMAQMEPATVEAPAPPPAPKQIAEPREGPAVQILSILQRKGRLIDFLKEDLSAYQDAQVGAAVRQIHENTRKALEEHVQLAPIFDETEGNTVTVQPGFDAEKIRLSGNIVGDPPFKGTLQHRGWRVVRVDLPERTVAPGEEMVLTAAEVEVQG